MFDAHPLSEFVRDASSHLVRLKTPKAPEALTVEGHPEVVVQDAEAYQAMVDELEGTRLVEAERDDEAGAARSANELFSELKRTHGDPSRRHPARAELDATECAAWIAQDSPTSALR